jgi:hypothetical protein
MALALLVRWNSYFGHNTDRLSFLDMSISLPQRKWHFLSTNGSNDSVVSIDSVQSLSKHSGQVSLRHSKFEKWNHLVDPHQFNDNWLNLHRNPPVSPKMSWSINLPTNNSIARIHIRRPRYPHETKLLTQQTIRDTCKSWQLHDKLTALLIFFIVEDCATTWIIGPSGLLRWVWAGSIMIVQVPENHSNELEFIRSKASCPYGHSRLIET